MRIGILISGRGSNMIAIVEAARRGEIPSAEIAIVISDQADAIGLTKARELGIETCVIERRGRSRTEHDAEIIAKLREKKVELVCLAGYMRLLSREFVQAFPDGILNIHPSLLPDFIGLDAQRQALEAGAKVSGCTVHYVDEELDHGPIIAQKTVPVLPVDTVETLSARILAEEHKLYVEALKQICAKSGMKANTLAAA